MIRLEIGGSTLGRCNTPTITGNALRAGATILFDVVDGFAPTVGQSFEVLGGPAQSRRRWPPRRLRPLYGAAPCRAAPMPPRHGPRAGRGLPCRQATIYILRVTLV